MEACATGPHKNLELIFPITLGTVPLYQVNSGSPQLADPSAPVPLYPPLQPSDPTEDSQIGLKVTPSPTAS